MFLQEEEEDQGEEEQRYQLGLELEHWKQQLYDVRVEHQTQKCRKMIKFTLQSIATLRVP